ncbi:hypothetical protein [Aquisphaera insulae]|uniref:hypothetical protein n=1 Tax=Aquisphaera insulae TaxID=2712864 RepID=UPI0013EC53E9|nr:hypothetical protein [Aquisphaera insulae]
MNRRTFFILPALAVATLAFGADDPKRSIDTNGLSFKAPESWKSVPASGMRAAQLKVAPVDGDEFPAELVLFIFPGGAGTVDQNVKRWQQQFKDADGNPPKIESKALKGKNVEVTRVETAGHYTPTNFPGRPVEPERDNARLFGAIVVTEKAGYFFKMVGPDKTMTALKPAFNELIESIEIEGK